MLPPPADPPASPWPRRAVALLLLVAAALAVLRTQVYFAPRRLDLATLPLTRLDGTPIPARDLTGKPVLLNLWAPWCPPCRTELPWLQQLQHEHPEALVIGVEDDPEQYQQALVMAADTHIAYLLTRSSPELRTRLGQLAGLPTSLYLSPSGRVIHTVTGPVHLDTMRRYLASAAAAK